MYGQYIDRMQVIFKTLPYAHDMATHLRQLREASGITVRELARQIGESHTNVLYWEASGNLPRSNVLIPMAKALGVTVEQLLGEARPRRAPVAGGRLGQLVEKVSALPRRQQEKVIDIFETVLVGQQTKANGH
jgi:transcriptional regulator with XRE-family HTH domain